MERVLLLTMMKNYNIHNLVQRHTIPNYSYLSQYVYVFIDQHVFRTNYWFPSIFLDWFKFNLKKKKKVLLSAVKKEEVGQRDLCHRRGALFVIIYNYDNEKEGRYHEKSVFFNFILNHQFITRGA